MNSPLAATPSQINAGLIHNYAHTLTVLVSARVAYPKTITKRDEDTVASINESIKKLTALIDSLTMAEMPVTTKKAH